MSSLTIFTACMLVFAHAAVAQEMVWKPASEDEPVFNAVGENAESDYSREVTKVLSKDKSITIASDKELNIDKEVAKFFERIVAKHPTISREYFGMVDSSTISNLALGDVEAIRWQKADLKKSPPNVLELATYLVRHQMQWQDKKRKVEDNLVIAALVDAHLIQGETKKDIQYKLTLRFKDFVQLQKKAP